MEVEVAINDSEFEFVRAEWVKIEKSKITVKSSPLTEHDDGKSEFYGIPKRVTVKE